MYYWDRYSEEGFIGFLILRNIQSLTFLRVGRSTESIYLDCHERIHTYYRDRYSNVGSLGSLALRNIKPYIFLRVDRSLELSYLDR